MTISDSTELSWTIDYIPNALLAECRRLYGDQTLHQDRARYRSRTVNGATKRKINDTHNEVTTDSTCEMQRGQREEEVRHLEQVCVSHETRRTLLGSVSHSAISGSERRQRNDDRNAGREADTAPVS